MNLFHYPMPRITLGVLAGCVLGSYTNRLVEAVGFFFISLILVLGLQLIRSAKWLRGMAILLLAIGIGMLSEGLHRECYYPNHYAHFCKNDKPQRVEAVVREQLKSTTFANRYVLQIQAIDGKACFGKLLLNCKKEGTTTLLPVGLRVQCAAIIQESNAPSNPAAFDYGKYLRKKNIYAQAWVQIGQIKRQPSCQLDAYYYADQLRNRINRNLDQAGCEPVAAALFKALFLGQQQDIPTEISKDYQYAGVVHILSVSGLHVGFILLLLRGCFRWLPKKRSFQLTELLLSILFLWAFAFVAGLSPSVLRAVTVFTFVSLGLFLHRSSSNLNALFVSAFLLLLVLPQAVFDIGFQLSYAALLFIFLLQPQLKKGYQPKTKIGRYLWENCSLSLAAQLGTLPLSLYYFHQFPGLFLVANVLLLPILAGIMGLGFICLIWLIIAVPPSLLIEILAWSIHLMNQLIHVLASVKGLVFEHIPCNLEMATALYLLLFALSYGLNNRNYKSLGYVGVAVIGFQLTVVAAVWNSKHEQESLIFHCSRYSALIVREGTKITAYTNLPESKRQSLYTYATAHFGNPILFREIPQKGVVNGQTIYIIDTATAAYTSTKNSVILMRNSPKINLDQLILCSQPKLIIADGSNYKSYIRRWKNSCIKAKIPFHATGEKGFYMLK